MTNTRKTTEHGGTQQSMEGEGWADQRVEAPGSTIYERATIETSLSQSQHSIKYFPSNQECVAL